jgi:hypothetical protein
VALLLLTLVVAVQVMAVEVLEQAAPVVAVQVAPLQETELLAPQTLAGAAVVELKKPTRVLKAVLAAQES